jgi:serine/threonine-protein kinase
MSKVFTITKGLENMGALRTGGQGSVYKGRRMGPIISAVKLLPTPIHTEDPEDKNFRNFRNEVEKLSKVNEVPNPNVVKILNSGLTESGSFPFIEMEFIEGPDLEDLLKPPHDSIFTIKETIKLADHLANALAHCHKVGVKHGDVKSNNVKYNVHSGNYVLLDFGLAIMSDEQRRTSIRHAGAIEFMAPEQNAGTMLFQTDIYSYGIILYELLAGQVPFPLHDGGETSRNAVMIAHMEAPVPDLSQLRIRNLPDAWPKEKLKQEMHVPKWLLSLIAKCLEKDPQKRFSNGIELQDALNKGIMAAEQQPLPVAVAPVPVQTAPIIRPEPPITAPVYRNDDLMHISKPLFFALMGLFLLSILTVGYLLFDRNQANIPVVKTAKDSLQKPNADTATNQQVVPSSLDKKRATDSARQQAIRDAIEKDREKAIQSGDSSNTTPDTAKQPVSF